MAVVGEVGAGKSSLLLSIIGEMLQRKPDSIRSTGAETAVGFMGQGAAIINGTIEVSAILVTGSSFHCKNLRNDLGCGAHSAPSIRVAQSSVACRSLGLMRCIAGKYFVWRSTASSRVTLGETFFAVSG